MIQKGSLVIEGQYVSPEGDLCYGQIKIVDGIIAEIGHPLGMSDMVYDPEFTIFPGFIDNHVHAREYPIPSDSHDADFLGKIRDYKVQTNKEDFSTMCDAAVNGGVVAFSDMPNNPVPPDDEDSYNRKVELADNRCYIDHVHYALITKGSQPFRDVPYKIYTHDFSRAEMREVLRRYAGCFVAMHCEDKDIIGRDPSRPPEAEIVGIEEGIDAANRFNIELHVAHVSTLKGLDMIVEARKSGVKVTCETTGTYLVLSKEMKEYFSRSARLTMKPPLRTEQDRHGLLDALIRGEIDWVTTDHAPHTLNDKDNGAFGIPLEDHYTNIVGWLLQNGVSEKRIAKVCSESPGSFFGRFKKEMFGRIEKGYVGSLTVVGRSDACLLSDGMVKTKCGWSPFDNSSLGDFFSLYAHETIVRGVPLKIGPHRAKVARRC